MNSSAAGPARAGTLGYQPRLWIDGKWQEARDGRTFEVVNPANGSVVESVACAGETETKDAIDAAARAFQQWRRTPVLERADKLWRIVELLREHREALAALATLEQGAPLSWNRGGVDYAISFFRWYAEETRRIYGRTIQHPDPRRHLRVQYDPIGVVGVITPWNGPLFSPAKKVAPALAAGCTVVIKPAELTPLSSLALAWIAGKAGLPPGVLNVVCGDAQAIGRAMLEHEALRGITFTGSTQTGRYLQSGAGPQIKRVLLELGGNAPFIIFADADLDQAVADLVWLKQFYSGQVCVTANRVFVETPVVEEVQRKLTERFGSLRLGDGFDPATELGPMIHRQAVERVAALVADSADQGARVLCGGTPPDRGPGECFFPPTVLGGVRRGMRITTEEIFGPVIPVIAFDTADELLAMANDTPYRLAAYFYTRDIGLAQRVADELNFGVVGINDPRPVTAEAPFGGIGQSGTGREGGSEGLMEFLDCKLIGTRA